MANTRIKDISTAATTLNSDDFIAVDGATSGTRKMAKADLITEVSTGVSGTYLEESNNLSDVASVPDSKGNLEIPDVGSSPDEVSLNGMLGSMAFQSAEAVSVAKLEVTDKVDGSLGVGVAPSTTVHLKSADPVIRLEDSSPDGVYGQIDGAGGSLILTADGGDGAGSSAIKFRVDGATAASDKVTIDSNGNVSVGGSTFTAGKFRVEDNNGNHVWLRGRSSDGTASVSFRNNADSAYNGRIQVDDSNGMNFQVAGSTRCTIDSGGNLILQKGGGAYLQLKDASAVRGSINVGTSDGLVFTTGSSFTERWRINASGNLVANSTGIDFGATNSTPGVTVTGSTLDHYETGTWTPGYEPFSGSFATMTVDIVSAVYCRIGDLVYASAYMRTDNVDTTGGSGGVVITGLPFASEANNTFNPITIGYASGWVTAPNGGYVTTNTNYIRLAAKTSVTGGHSEGSIGASSFTSGANADKNLLIFSVTYRTA